MGHANPFVNAIQAQPAGRWVTTPTGTYRAIDATCGDYLTEADAAAAFDELAPCDMFDVATEVSGALRWPLHGQEVGTRVRIDRVLVPTQRTLDAGWEHGAIGVEIKKSGVKAGKSLNQMFDYLRSTFTIAGQQMQLGYAVLWPYRGPEGGVLSSIFHGQRLAYAHPTDDGIVMRRTDSGGSTMDLIVGNWVFGYRAGRAELSSKVGSR